MVRFINIWKEKNIVDCLAYDIPNGHWLCEHEYMAAIEDNDGSLISAPLMYLDDKLTADECLRLANEAKAEIIVSYDCPARDAKIKEYINEWISNEACVSGGSIIEAVCSVVSLLTRYGMWKEEYSKSIDMTKIKDDCGEE